MYIYLLNDAKDYEYDNDSMFVFKDKPSTEKLFDLLKGIIEDQNALLLEYYDCDNGIEFHYNYNYEGEIRENELKIFFYYKIEDFLID